MRHVSDHGTVALPVLFESASVKRVEIAMMRTPDNHSRLELSRFLKPTVVADRPDRLEIALFGNRGTA
jgi:hypothetical protein